MQKFAIKVTSAVGPKVYEPTDFEAHIEILKANEDKATARIEKHANDRYRWEVSILGVGQANGFVKGECEARAIAVRMLNTFLGR